LSAPRGGQEYLLMIFHFANVCIYKNVAKCVLSTTNNSLDRLLSLSFCVLVATSQIAVL